MNRTALLEVAVKALGLACLVAAAFCVNALAGLVALGVALLTATYLP